MTLLALVLLVGLVAYVMNLGREVNRRIEAQNAADAAAAAGAGWIARSLNTVASNNVAMTRLISLIIVADGMPQAVDVTRADQRPLERALEQQLRRGAGPGWVDNALDRARAQVDDNLNLLNTAATNLGVGSNPDDVAPLTMYQTPSGNRGRFWIGISALAGHSATAMRHLGSLAQINAGEGSRANIKSGRGLLLPARPQIPWQRGDLADLRRPVLHGLLPQRIDAMPNKRGPFDAVFGWRHIERSDPDGKYQQSRRASGGAGNTPISGGAGGGGGTGFVVTDPGEPEAYHVSGPLARLRRRVTHFARDELPLARFMSWLGRHIRRKRHLLWPRRDGDAPAASFIEPNWEISFPRSTAIGKNRPERIRATRFVAVEIKSRYDRSHPSFLSPGSWAYVSGRPPGRRGPPARLVHAGGWEDPRDWGVPRITDFIWRDTWTYQVFFDRSIGIRQRLDPLGNPIPQTVHRIDTFMFAGVDLGGPSRTIRNPFNFGSRDAVEGPVLLDHGTLPPAARGRGRLRYLAVTESPRGELMWKDRFTGSPPSGPRVALAAAEVFNNHSWDLWTPMWHAQLAPIAAGTPQRGSYRDWLSRLRSANAGRFPGWSPSAYNRVVSHLQGIEPLATEMLTH